MKQLLILGSLLICGCAFNRQLATTTNTNQTNGVVSVTRAVSTTYALWDAQAIVAKTRASAGKTSTVGSVGVDEQANSTNMATNLSALVQLLNALK